MPSDQLHVFEVRPLMSDKLDSRGVSSVELDRRQRRKGPVEKAGDEVRIRGGGQGVTPWGEKRDVEVGYGCEAVGDHEEVAEVATEGEGSTCGALQKVPLAADD